jgi:Cache domain
MAKTKYELDTRILAVFFLAAAPFMAFGAYVMVSMAKGQLGESVGASLEQRAVETKLSLERYVGEQIVHLRLLALDPLVRSAVSLPVPALNLEDRRHLDEAWVSGGDPKATSPLVQSPAAGQLRQLVSIRPAFKLVQVVGPTGQLVASTSRAGRLQQADAAWFKAFASVEAGEQAFVGGIQRQPGSQTGVLEIAYPMRDTGGTFLGAVCGLVDAADLYGVLAPVRVGGTGHAVLMRSTDGIVLASDDSERILKEPFPGFASLQGAVEGFPQGEHAEALFGKTSPRRGYGTIPEVKAKREDGKEVRLEPARLVGFTKVDQIPDVRWMVVVEQDLDEALAPISSVTRYLWLHFVGAFTTVVLLALYFSFKAERPIIEEEMHLHEEHVPAGGRPSES